MIVPVLAYWLCWLAVALLVFAPFASTILAFAVRTWAKRSHRAWMRYLAERGDGRWR